LRKGEDGSPPPAPITRFGTLGMVPRGFLLRSSNGVRHRARTDGPLFTSRRHTAPMRSCGMTQARITPHCPQQNGRAERTIRTLKEPCLHRRRFGRTQHAPDTLRCKSQVRREAGYRIPGRFHRVAWQIEPCLWIHLHPRRKTAARCFSHRGYGPCHPRLQSRSRL